MDESAYHVPVLLQEVLDGLNIKPTGTYVDCTFGGGGHSKEILKKLGKEGRLIAFDQDADAKQNVPDDPRVEFIPHNFRHLQRFLRLHKISSVDGILADLGVSSHQFDEASRGFSTRFESDLDMRMDTRQETKAFISKMIVRKWTIEGLFAEAKQFHGLRRARYRGLQKVSIQALMTAMAQNIKRIIKKLLDIYWYLRRYPYFRKEILSA